MAKKGKEAKRREKKQRTGKKHMSVKVHEYYEVSGESVKRKRKSCPRCGPGAWLAEHKGRLYCGKCGYTEFEKRQEAPAAEKPPEKIEEAAAPPEEKNPPEAERPAEAKKEEQAAPEKEATHEDKGG
jgi:small subunit ribosomal protein S27Ae